jgi:hypothetical protein
MTGKPEDALETIPVKNAGVAETKKTEKKNKTTNTADFFSFACKIMLQIYTKTAFFSGFGSKVRKYL